MTSIEQLKQELLTQKAVIETKGGTVTPAHTNPSPAEITAGINSIPVLDMSNATATEEDVITGKTFYAVSGELKTGSLETLDANTLEIYYNNYHTTPISTKTDYHVRPGTLKLRDYFMCCSNSTIDMYFNSELQEIGAHAFQQCYNFELKNFQQVQNLTKIGDYALHGVKHLDLTNIPASITTIGKYGFAETVYNNPYIKVPSTVTSVDKNCFGTTSYSKRLHCEYFDISEAGITSLAEGMFQGVVTNTDFVTPSWVTSIPNWFTYYGSVKTFTVTSNVTILNGYIVGVPEGEPAENKRLQSITLEGVTPPKFNGFTFGPTYMLDDVYIYVPDQSVEAYKAAKNCSMYKNNIKPMSEKP